VDINPRVFNNYFLNIADIAHKIYNLNDSNADTNNIYKHYLNLTAKGPFPKIIFNSLTTKQSENVTSCLSSKSSSGYDQISMKRLLKTLLTSKIISRRLLPHVHAVDILANVQFGFRPKLSTETALYTSINKVLTAINNKNKVAGIFFDSIMKYFYINWNVMV
jgi:hypothetical protein